MRLPTLSPADSVLNGVAPANNGCNVALAEHLVFDLLNIDDSEVTLPDLSAIDDTDVACFLLSSEVMPLCLHKMEAGNELSKTVATYILKKVLLDEEGFREICSSAEKFYSVSRVLGKMVVALAEQPSARLLKYVIHCYLLLSDSPRPRDVLRAYLPDKLRDDTFSSCLREDPKTQRRLQQLLHNLSDSTH